MRYEDAGDWTPGVPLPCPMCQPDTVSGLTRWEVNSTWQGAVKRHNLVWGSAEGLYLNAWDEHNCMNSLRVIDYDRERAGKEVLDQFAGIYALIGSHANAIYGMCHRFRHDCRWSDRRATVAQLKEKLDRLMKRLDMLQGARAIVQERRKTL